MPPEELQPKPLTKEQKRKYKRIALLIIGWLLIMLGAVDIAGDIAGQKVPAFSNMKLDTGGLIFVLLVMALGIFLVDKSKTFRPSRKQAKTNG